MKTTSLYQIQAMMMVERKKEEDEENFHFLYFKISKPYLNADKRCHLVESGVTGHRYGVWNFTRGVTRVTP